MTARFDAPRSAVVAAVAGALAEDLTPLGDLTSALLPDGARADAAVVSRDQGVLAGTACLVEAFAQVDTSVEVVLRLADGDRLEPGRVVAEVRGPLAPVLTAERTALNLLGHLSGVASLTARYVDALAEQGSPTRVWDTRKTTPGLRALEKAAVRAGGGANHRGNLSDWVLLKDNHLVGTTIAEAVARARQVWPGRTVHVECDRLDQVVEAVEAGADALLLDNMSPDQVRACVAEVEARSGGRRRPLLEASGGIDLETIAGYAAVGLDCISVGRLTNSAPVLDVGLDVAAADEPRDEEAAPC